MAGKFIVSQGICAILAQRIVSEIPLYPSRLCGRVPVEDRANGRSVVHPKPLFCARLASDELSGTQSGLERTRTIIATPSADMP